MFGELVTRDLMKKPFNQNISFELSGVFSKRNFGKRQPRQVEMFTRETQLEPIRRLTQLEVKFCDKRLREIISAINSVIKWNFFLPAT